MAFPFSMLNIANLAAGFKSQTHVLTLALKVGVTIHGQCQLVKLSS